MIDSKSPRRPGEVIYHFDVERGSIPLAQFVETARATQEIIDDFNKFLFDEKLKYELRVKTPEEGSLVEVLAVVVIVGGSILKFLGTDIGKAFFKGLTTEDPASWAEKVGTTVRLALNKPKPVVEADSRGVLVQIDTPAPAAVLDANVQKHIEGEAIALILIRFLETDIERLKVIGITPEKFRAAFQGRNRVFKGCIDNPEVKAITFDREPNFNIKRSDFPRHITQLPDPPPEEPPEITDWSIETVDIVVNSPNWKRDGRKWQAATNKYQDIAFSVEDDRFWFAVERKEIQPAIRDNMRVQWAFPAGLSKPANVRVLRVLNYNGKPISAALSEVELQALLTAVHFVEPDIPDLFDERRGSKDSIEKGSA